MTARVVELDAVPGLGGSYLRGVAGSAAASVGAIGRGNRVVRADDLPPTELLVRRVLAEAEHLTAYQHLVGETAGDAMPAGFVHVLAFPVATALMTRRGFPLPLLGMVHLANRVDQHRAVRLGEAVDVRVSARDLRSHRAGVTVDVIARVSVGTELVWEGVSTYLAKGHRLATHSASTSPAPATGPGDAGSAGDAGTPATTSLLPTGQWRLAADVGRRYAAVSGDRNPIHTSTPAAKAFGFPRAIAHGMYTAARALADVGPARGEAYRWEVRFAKPVLLPSTVSVRVAPDDGVTGMPSAPGHRFAVWSPRTGRQHLDGQVAPL